jgi:peptidyl-prolyl cis-trans isomerase C
MSVLLCLVFVCALTSCSKAPKPEPVTFLAKVGDVRITVEDLQKEVARRQAARRAVPDKETLLQEMVEQTALLQRAKDSGVDRDPQLQREIHNLIIGRFLDRETTARREAVTVTTNEVQAEYERNLARYTQPAKVRLALLVQRVDPKASEAKRAEARARIEEARRLALAKPASAESASGVPGFGALAVDYSDDQTSRYRGGDIGWLDSGSYVPRWPKKVFEAAFALEQGKTSEVIETDDGFYLAMKTDLRPGSVVPFVQVEASLRQSLLVRKRHEADVAVRQEAIRLIPSEINRAALSTVELPAAGLASATNRDLKPPALPAGNPSLPGQ